MQHLHDSNMVNLYNLAILRNVSDTFRSSHTHPVQHHDLKNKILQETFIVHHARFNHEHNHQSNLFSLSFVQLHYRYDYNANVKGKHTSPAVTMETERVRLANHVQSDVS